MRLPHGSREMVMTLLYNTGQLTTQEFSLYNRLMTVILGSFEMNGWVGTLLYALFANRPPAERFVTGVLSSSAFHLCTKYWYLYLSQEKVKSIMRISDQLWASISNKELKDSCERKCKSAIITFFIVLNTIVIIAIFKGLFNIGVPVEDRQLPFPCLFIPDEREWIITNCIWENITLGVIMFDLSIYYCFLYVFTLHISMQIRAVRCDLESSSIDIKLAVKQHELIIRIAKLLNDVTSGLITLEIVLCASHISITGYNTMKMVQNQASIGTIAFGAYAAFLYTCFSYLLCLCGDLLTDESEKLFVSTYMSRWYDYPLPQQKSIKLMMCMSSRPLQLQYKRIFVYNMPRYAMLINATYSYLTLLFGMDL